MWMELHGLSHDVGNLGIAAVIHAPHGMKHTSLHRLQTINKMWYGTVEHGI